MGIFTKGEPLSAPPRYKIRITTVEGQTFYWHKRGVLHVVEEDVARIFVAKFKPELFEVSGDGSLSPPEPGRTQSIVRVEMERV